MDITSYYSSHAKLPFIGPAGQELLHRQKVLVIGAGGLGCPCLQSLAGSGIGTIGIADFDKVSVSNLHRQNLYDYSDVNKLKAEVAVKKLSLYNPCISIQKHDLYVDDSNITELVSNYNVIVDGTDNFFTRYLINDACVVLNKPLVYGAIHRDEGHVTVFNYEGSPTLRCLFPNDEDDTTASCASIGAYNITTGIIGLLMANEVIKLTLSNREILAGKLLQVDTLTGRTFIAGYTPAAESRQQSFDRFTNSAENITINAESLKEKIRNKEKVFLIDVREPQEHFRKNIGGINIPLSALMQAAPDMPLTTDIIVYCQMGNRSRCAAAWLAGKGFLKVASLTGGIESYQNIPA